jgi:hypothetical protein
VTASEEELLAAWRSDRVARAAGRGARRDERGTGAGGAAPVRLGRGEFYEGIIDLEILGASYDDDRDLITVRREHSRSVIPGTVTTVTRCDRVRCGGMTWRDVRLCYVHEYSEPDLDAVLAEIGYTTVAKLHRGVRGADTERVVLLYLLQKP